VREGAPEGAPLNRLSCAFLVLATTLSFDAGAGPRDSVILNGDAYFPEGPIWYRDKLYYVEYGRDTVTVWDGKNNSTFASERGCGPSAVVPTIHGEFIVTCYDNGSLGRFSADGNALPAYTHDKDGRKFLGPNDFAPDSHGGIYFTTSGHPGPVIDGSVFYLAPDDTITRVASDLHNANGLAVSRDGKILYVVETEDNRLLRFMIGRRGSLTDRRVFVNLDELTQRVGHIWPDGIKIDSKGDIYIGQSPRDTKAPLVGKIFVVDPHARLVRTLTLPSTNVPNFALSPDEKTLYVMAVDEPDMAPYRGKVYAVPNE
jgi:gluconolactonase